MTKRPINPSNYITEAQKAYKGPEEMFPFADILPFIGELVISFSRLERRMTWGIESLLFSTKDEADEMEDFVKNFSSRVKFFELVGRPVARETNTEADFEKLVLALTKANTVRNQTLHNAFTGIAYGWDRQSGKILGFSALKSRYSPNPNKRGYAITTIELRRNVELNLAACGDIQRWILTVRPDAENRVP